MSFIPKPHEIYKHFKGNLYQITAIAEHSETGETLVVYQAMYGDFKTFARPLAMFVSPVDREKYPDAAQEFCFELQGPDAARQKAEADKCPRAEDTDSGRPVSAQDIASQKAPGSLGEEIPFREPQGQVKASPELQGQGKASPELRRQGISFLESQGQEKLSLQPEQESGGEPEELNIDPFVLEFLDADSYEERLNILAGLHHRITDDMITTMAIACDLEVGDGDIEERYESLKTCLLTMERYECNRLR